MELICFLGAGEGTWGQVAGVINRGDWDSIIIIGDEFARKFNVEKDFEFIEVKSTGIVDLKEEILGKLKGKIKGTEAALSIASGNGKEHMAVLSAIMRLGVGFRLIAATKEGVSEI